MLGLVESSLLLVPIVLYAIWYFTAARGGPSPLALTAGAVMLAILAATLFWYVGVERIDPSAIYIPPKIQDGRLIPGHAMPK